MTEKALLSLSKRLARDQELTTEHASTRLAQLRNTNRQNMLSDLKGIGKSGSLENIITAEKSIIKFDLKWYANSKSMESSLKGALEELESIETNIGLLADTQKYQHVDVSFGQRKLRDGDDLPLDGARVAFRSHIARLGNYDKAKSDDHEKATIQARRQNIRIAEKLYIGRQEQTLGRNFGNN
jgi:hypothetical protein